MHKDLLQILRTEVGSPSDFEIAAPTALKMKEMFKESQQDAKL